MKRREFIQGVAAVGLGCRRAAAGNQTTSISRENPGIRPQTLGRTGAQVSILALGGVIGMQLPPSEGHDPVAIAETALDLGIIAMKVMGGGNGCLVTGNPFKQLRFPYHDDTSHQVDARSLIRYALGLPISVAVIGVASVDQLKQNVRIVREARPMTAAERQELETAMG